LRLCESSVDTPVSTTPELVRRATHRGGGTGTRVKQSVSISPITIANHAKPVAAAVVLLIGARSYPCDVATAVASEQATKQT